MYLDNKINCRITSDLPALFTLCLYQLWNQTCTLALRSVFIPLYDAVQLTHFTGSPTHSAGQQSYIICACEYRKHKNCTLLQINCNKVFSSFSAKTKIHRENYDWLVHLRKDSVTSIDQPDKPAMSNFKDTHCLPQVLCLRVSVLLFTHMSWAYVCLQLFSSRCFTCSDKPHSSTYLWNWGIELVEEIVMHTQRCTAGSADLISVHTVQWSQWKAQLD